MPATLEKSAPSKPFLKWAGGKSQLIDEIDKRLPKELRTGEIDTYIEPFVGGGAVFFHIAKNFGTIRHFYLFDVNEDLIACYNTIKNDVEALIGELQELAHIYRSSKNTKELYLSIRHKFNETKCRWTVVNAAQLIFLNKTCFNGLYRVNKQGYFNVPFGGYEYPPICNPKNLRNVSSLLRKTKIICTDFEASLRYLDNHTFVYFDPPYRPISKTASFTSYSKDSFSEEDQIRLANFCRKIHKKGAKFLLSNSDPQNENPDDHFFQDHYGNYGFHIDKVKASRAINCKASGRGQINELLITNYEV
jgi:DNA adenine methylase